MPTASGLIHLAPDWQTYCSDGMAGAYHQDGLTFGTDVNFIIPAEPTSGDAQ